MNDAEEDDCAQFEEDDHDDGSGRSRRRCILQLSTSQKRGGLLIFSLLYIPLFAGAFFGFGPMQVMLEESGSFSCLCDDGDDNATTTTTTANDDDVCPEQTARLLTIPFLGQLMILSSPLLGILVDRYGSLSLMALLGCSGCLGVLMLLLAVVLSIDKLLFVAFVCIGLMSCASSIMTVKTGMVFASKHNDEEEEERTEKTKDEDGESQNGTTATTSNKKREDKNQSRVISILNALFDAGSITYLGLWGVTEVGPSVATVFAIYLVLAIVCFGGATFFWWTLLPHNKGSYSDGNRISATVGIQDEDERRRTLDTVAASALLGNNEFYRLPRNETMPEDNQEDVSTGQDLEATAAKDNMEPVAYVPVCQRSARDQLLSWPFLMLLLFFAINLGLNQFVLTTARDFLDYLAGDDDQAKQYLAIFTLLMPASILGLPFTDLVISRYGYHVGFQMVCLLATVHGIIQVACDRLNGVQVFGFVVFSFYRCFLFSIVFSYLPTLLSPNVVGKGVGAMHFCGGAFSFVNIPLSNIAVTRLDGNFFLPNLLYTLLVLPCSVAAWMIGKSIQLERASKQLQRNITTS